MRISDWSSDVCSSDLQRRRRCDRTVVIGVAQARAAGTVVAELALLALVDLHRALRAVAGGQAPDVLAVPLPVHRVLDRIGALCQRGAAAVLERSEEHTSELQSLMRISYAVFCLKKKKEKIKNAIIEAKTLP